MKCIQCHLPTSLSHLFFFPPEAEQMTPCRLSLLWSNLFREYTQNNFHSVFKYWNHTQESENVIMRDKGYWIELRQSLITISHLTFIPWHMLIQYNNPQITLSALLLLLHYCCLHFLPCFLSSFLLSFSDSYFLAYLLKTCKFSVWLIWP